MRENKINVYNNSNRKLRRLAAKQNQKPMMPGINGQNFAYTEDRKIARKKGLLKINSLNL